MDEATTLSVLIAAAWAEHEAARAEYKAAVRQARGEGRSKRSTDMHPLVIGPRHRLSRAWMSLHELGEVPLTYRYSRPRPEE